PYLQTTYEASPLNRPVAQHGAGEAWAEHPVSYQYITRNPRSFPSSYYMTPSGNFLGVCTTDEDGNQAYEFKDGFGRTILAGRMDGPDPCFAYYEYDNHDDLVNVYPPFVTYYQMNEPEGPYQTQSSYSYHYDFLHRCVYKKLPERDAIYYIYDHGDHQVLSQDGEQRVRGEWAFSLSDELNRPVLTGICHNSYYYADFPLCEIDVKARRDDTGTAFHGYILENIPLTNPVVYTVNYYDDYSFIGKHGVPTSLNYVTPPSGYGTCYTESSKGLLTGTVTARLDATGVTGYDYAAFYYDERGRIIQSRATNHMGGIEEEYVAYSFTGDPLKRQHVHTATGYSTQTEVCTYEYDHAGRLLTTKHKLNTNEEVTLVENTYDDLGRIKSSKRHGNSALTTDYTYNVRSWMKTLTTDTLFNQTLHYNDSYGGSRACYNGNISAMSWKAAGDTGVHGYRFSYDEMSRLTAAGYLWNGSPSANYDTSYTYNRQSNLTSLRRNGRTGTSSYGLIDDLTLTLDGNWLTRVDDAATSSAYNNGFEFKDAVKQDNEYTYDKNGNMTKDLNKKITDIQYNCLNSPSKVTFQDDSTITYTYAVNGTKLRTVHTIGDTTSTTDYCGNVIYENGAQKLLLTDAGHITLSDKKYHYYLQDHQGNNRVVVDQTGQKEEVNHYYPFGGTFASAEKSIQPYKYNGKELDTKNGLNWYDYGARYYDVAIGRWNAVDPMAEMYYSWSPYAYCVDSPTNYVDPTGCFSTKFGAWLYKLFNGGDQILKDIGGEYFVSTQVEHSGDEVGATVNRRFDWNGRNTGRNLAVEKQWNAYIADTKFQELCTTHGMEYVRTENQSDAVAGMLQPAMQTIIPVPFIKSGNALINAVRGQKNVTTPVIRFGGNANQVYHTFRHTDALGLDRSLVQSMIRTHFETVSSQVVAGRPFNQVIRISGRNIQYTVFKLSDGTFNIGRIHEVL
ncbi:RHS repeat-associated core domain-containing protein, partial [Bacteroides ovatus]